MKHRHLSADSGATRPRALRGRFCPGAVMPNECAAVREPFYDTIKRVSSGCFLLPSSISRRLFGTRHCYCCRGFDERAEITSRALVRSVRTAKDGENKIALVMASSPVYLAAVKRRRCSASSASLEGLPRARPWEETAGRGIRFFS